ncbi:flagellar hook-length control protein FliK [Bacillus pseudomycoides]|uniref:Flagellar hook-length control protein FliK n=1 Tax=Bacillus pseudomycoides TaxID=64104 RepID=A0AA91VD21_9BACI|nr:MULTISPECIES: flagellar hook-length control protein FliK [Bacillus]PEB53937.1 flagellar hook-length control protein FliK [Bacillus sp. AFS098217]PED82950.1 flagellar hook-length control protein FliK [Bacillus pseudomycoides]PEU06137.1 flagellar hook-length control protein FliK [Bacillus sp. AFS019443]PEU17435.1 flagellar hook-length control protein FliK [Bacillus sp. AFS014408]PFW62539.1 flagellar hook-length control protein FliK [Bacillus sp. AFS075034]
MDEVNTVIEPIFPVQPSLPPQKGKGLELQSKDVKSSFLKKMNEQDKKQPKTEGTGQKEAPQEEQQEYLLARKSLKQEETSGNEKKEEKKTTEELLLAVSEQMMAIEHLRAQPELLYQYIQKIQELYKTYGNIKINELPAGEIQQLQAFFKEFNIENAICSEDTIQMILEKVTSSEKLAELSKSIQIESCDLTKKGASDPLLNKEVVANAENKMKTLAGEQLQKETFVGLEEKSEKQVDSEGEQGINPIFVGNDQVLKKDGEQLQAQKVSLPDLGNKMEAKVEALQKLIVKQERVLFQLNPEKLGTLTVYMKKQGDSIQVHVEMEKHDAKKRVEMIFDELKFKLKEKEIHIELSYTNKDQQRQQQEREQAQKQQRVMVKKEKASEQDFAGLLEED